MKFIFIVLDLLEAVLECDQYDLYIYTARKFQLCGITLAVRPFCCY